VINGFCEAPPSQLVGSLAWFYKNKSESALIFRKNGTTGITMNLDFYDDLKSVAQSALAG
jgi:hypothetical protein